MRVVERRIEVTSRTDEIALYGLFDIHCGSVRCREDKLKRIIDKIKINPGAYWIGGGDFCEFINRNDPRYKESDLAPWLHGKDDIAEEQIKHLITLLAPITPQCIGVLSGNHESAILKHHERNVYSRILDAVKDMGGIKNPVGIGYGGFIRLRIVRGKHITTLTIFAEHGYGGGRLKGADVLNSQRIFAYYDCDVYLAGHRHKAHVIPHTRIEIAGHKARELIKIAGMTGSFRERVTEHDEHDPGGYEDEKGYPPGDTAGVLITFNPDKIELRGEVYPY